MQCRTMQFFIDCWCDASVANAYKAIKERTLGKLCLKDLGHDEDFAMFKLHIIDLEIHNWISYLFGSKLTVRTHFVKYVSK